MKTKIMMVMLAVAGIAGSVFSQQTITYFLTNQQSRSDAIFNTPYPGSSRIRFDFQLPAGNKMMLEFTSLNQIDSLPDINTGVMRLSQDLKNLPDSLNDPLMSRRVDFYMGQSDIKVRIQQYTQKGDVYRVKNGGITQLKVEQDTLRIRLFTKGITKNVGGQRTSEESYYVTFILNNLSELGNITKDGKLAEAVSLLKKDLDVRSNKKRSNLYSRYYAVYEVETGKRISPVKDNRIGSRKLIVVPPYVQTAIQYARGMWIPSAGAGLELVSKSAQDEDHFRLIWEPYFVFDRDINKKLVMDRNDFITFKYNYISRYVSSTREIYFAQNFSFGYLVRRKGDAFEKNTMKFALPGLQTKNILLEPEFFFNNFFKHFSPSVKLTLFFE